MSGQQNRNSSASSGGIGFCGLLTIVFIVLKLCHVIDWSWLWVLSPLWIPTSLALGVLLILLIIVSIRKIILKNKRRKWDMW